jgi:membrane peptidoglycan carboxypeptidase
MLESHSPGLGANVSLRLSLTKEARVLKRADRKIRFQEIKEWFIERPVILVLALAAIVLAIFFFSREFATSRFQASYFSSRSQELRFAVEEGKSDAIRFPSQGPYDIRLGYTRLPDIISKLTSKPYEMKVTSQAQMSPAMIKMIDSGIFATYREKTQAGIQILDQDKKTIFSDQYPKRIYRSYDEIPALVLNTLLFIENRELLNKHYPYKNPAIEWDRFSKAIGDLAFRKVFGGRRGPGGSTIATQLEKYRHSAEGRTQKPTEKIQQMYSAALRAYLGGPATLAVRKNIILDYINSIPLAAIPKYGEVNGLGDGLWSWFNADFDQVNQSLKNSKENNAKDLRRKATAYVETLGLFLAHRRPSEYLLAKKETLDKLTKRYLRVLYRYGIISRELRDEALKIPLPFRVIQPELTPVSFLDRKAANLVRTSLLSLFGMDRLYELDRFDLTVASSINSRAQDQVTEALRKLSIEKNARDAGLFADRIFQPGKKLEKVMYSFTLYERGAYANYVRIETDNLDQPFNINHGVKLDLGSTAKLRTLLTYLDIVSELHKKWSPLSAEDLKAIVPHHADHISKWTHEYLSSHPGATLLATLEASMERTYSANPGERFFTGGGLHVFNNFKHEDDGRTMNLWEAMQQSVNLVLVRLMRDIVSYYSYRDVGNIARILEDPDNEKRLSYLAQFADKEGSQFLNTFLQKYRGLSEQEIVDTLLSRTKLTTVRYAAVLRALNPQQDFTRFSTLMRSRFGESQLGEAELVKLYNKFTYAVGNLPDRGYIAKIHPLEIWLASYLIQNPKSTRAEMLAASSGARQEVYQWLLRSKHKNAQNSRIRVMLESEAFREIHRQWKKLGYPFEFLIPSLATSIGSSADKPAALAELMGILVNDGLRLPTVAISSLHFAEKTPFETLLTEQPRTVERVLPQEVAQVAKRALVEIVEKGTARRVFQAFKDADGNAISVGGKTGTGDHRFESYGAGGRLISSRVVNRTATFVFFIGEKYFGTLTAFVPGDDAASFKFTSALPVQILKHIAPLISESVFGIPPKIVEVPKEKAKKK